MTVVADASPLSQMLNKAFAKFDRDGNNKLTGDELITLIRFSDRV